MDPLEVYESRKNGFKSSEVIKTGIYDFADIDDKFLITIHHWMKCISLGLREHGITYHLKLERVG